MQHLCTVELKQKKIESGIRFHFEKWTTKTLGCFSDAKIVIREISKIKQTNLNIKNINVSILTIKKKTPTLKREDDEKTRLKRQMNPIPEKKGPER